MPDYESNLPESPKGAGGGWFLPLLVSVGLKAVGDYFTSKSQQKAQRGLTEYDWRMRMELEDKRIAAERELDRERRRLPTWAYNALKQELSKPLSPHGETPTKLGSFRDIVGAARSAVQTQPTQGIQQRQLFQPIAKPIPKLQPQPIGGGF